MASWGIRTIVPSTRLLLLIGQLFFAALYLGLLIYSVVHKGWWSNVSFPFGFGIGSSIATATLSLSHFLTYSVNSSTRSGRFKATVFKALRILVELLILGLWTTTFVCMLLPKGKDFRHAFDKPPYGTWGAGAAVAFVQM